MSISPTGVLAQVVNALPEDMIEDVVIVGSLAAGVHFFGGDSHAQVRTKDIDCLLSPHVRAVRSGRLAIESLLDHGWVLREDEKWGKPGTSNTPVNELPVARLKPSEEAFWFLEILGAPGPEDPQGRQFRRLETRHGHFALCSFRFLALAEHQPIKAESGIRVARPEMMALANLLHHPEVRPDTMSGLIDERRIKRSNKDLGRVLALAWLAVARDEDALERWPALWLEALQAAFKDDWRDLVSSAGRGLEMLLDARHQEDFEEARHTCVYGLLATDRPGPAAFRATGERVLEEGVRELQRLADGD